MGKTYFDVVSLIICTIQMHHAKLWYAKFKDKKNKNKNKCPILGYSKEKPISSMKNLPFKNGWTSN